MANEPSFLDAVIRGANDEVVEMLKDGRIICLSLTALCEVKNVDTAKLLIGAGFDVNERRGHISPLTFAVSDGNLPLVKCFVEAGAHINSCDGKETPLHKAAWKGFLEIVQYLVECGANINAKQSGGETPLHYAVSYRKLDVVKYLVFAGADYLITNNKGLSAYDLASNDREIKEFFDYYTLCLESFRSWNNAINEFTEYTQWPPEELNNVVWGLILACDLNVRANAQIRGYL